MFAVSEQIMRPHVSMWRCTAERLRGWISEKELSREFWIFLAAALCFDLGFAIYFFLYNLFLLDIGFRERQLGLIASAMTIGGVIGTIPVGVLARRVSSHRLLLAGFILAPAVSVLRTLVVSERAELGLAVLTGICFCLWSVSFSPMAAKLTTDKNRPFAFSLLFSTGIGMGVLGGVAGGCLPGWLQTIAPSMRSSDAKRIVLIMCCAIVMFGIWPISRLKLRVEPETRRGSWKVDPFLFRFLPAIALWSLVIGSFTPFATAYLSRHIQISLPHIGMIASASQLAQVLAVLIAPAVFKRFGLVSGIMYTQVATALAIGALAHARHVPLVVILYLSFTAFQWMSGPGIYSLLMNRVAERERSNASAANILVTSLFQAIGSAVSGAAYANFGYPAVLCAVAGTALLAAFLLRALLQDSGDCAAVAAAPTEG